MRVTRGGRKGVGEEVAVTVGVTVGVGVQLGIGVGVRVALAVGDRVSDGVSEAVAGDVAEGALVGAMVGVLEGARVRVAVGRGVALAGARVGGSGDGASREGDGVALGSGAISPSSTPLGSGAFGSSVGLKTSVACSGDAVAVRGAGLEDSVSGAAPVAVGSGVGGPARPSRVKV